MALKRGGWIKRKKKSPEEVEKSREEGAKMIAFFQEVWDERGPYCQITGKFLGQEMRTVFMDHILEKVKR